MNGSVTSVTKAYTREPSVSMMMGISILTIIESITASRVIPISLANINSKFSKICILFGMVSVFVANVDSLGGDDVGCL